MDFITQMMGGMGLGKPVAFLIRVLIDCCQYPEKSSLPCCWGREATNFRVMFRYKLSVEGSKPSVTSYSNMGSSKKITGTKVMILQKSKLMFINNRF
jgi:hypothetical protein